MPSTSEPPRGTSWAAHQGFAPDDFTGRGQKDTGRQWPPLLGVQFDNRLEGVADIGLRFLQSIALSEQLRQYGGGDRVAAFRLRGEQQWNTVHHAIDPPADRRVVSWAAPGE